MDTEDEGFTEVAKAVFVVLGRRSLLVAVDVDFGEDRVEVRLGDVSDVDDFVEGFMVEKIEVDCDLETLDDIAFLVLLLNVELDFFGVVVVIDLYVVGDVLFDFLAEELLDEVGLRDEAVGLDGGVVCDVRVLLDFFAGESEEVWVVKCGTLTIVYKDNQCTFYRHLVCHLILRVGNQCKSFPYVNISYLHHRVTE